MLKPRLTTRSYIIILQVAAQMSVNPPDSEQLAIGTQLYFLIAIQNILPHF